MSFKRAVFTARAALAALVVVLGGASTAAAAGFHTELARFDALLAEPPGAPRVRIALPRLASASPNSGKALRAPERLARLYDALDHEAVWTSGAMALSLKNALVRGELDGLAPGELRRHARQDPLGSGATLTSVERELLLSDTLLALLDRLANGRADARGLSPAPDDAVAWRDADAMELDVVAAALRRGDIVTLIESARPATALYARLRTAMEAELADRAAGMAATPIGAGDTLEAGSRGERVRRLRERLQREGDLRPVEGLAALRWDDELARSVALFQARNGLEPDGKVGPVTRAHLDLSSDARIDALRINLERARWFARAVGEGDRVVVNIPDYRLSVHLDGERVWDTPVVVGKRSNRTPVFVSRLDEVVLDPTWTVPRSIIEDRLYEQARSDPHDFSRQGFRFRDVAGRWHDPTDIDWDNRPLERFHFDMVQMPSAANALGAVKFRFDNPYSVYLHDTPAKRVFDEPARAFSHGCVRVQDAKRLETLLLSRRGGLDAQAIASLRTDTDNVSVELLEPVTVALLYWTADVDERGRLRMLPDVYGRDRAILDALDRVAS